MYSPKIEANLVRKLYVLKAGYARIGITKPMTGIVKEALIRHIPKAEKEIHSVSGTIPNSDDRKTNEVKE